MSFFLLINLFVQGTDKCKELLRQALVVVAQIPHDVGLVDPTDTMNEQEPSEVEHHISVSAPPVSSTKGSRAKGVQDGDVPMPHFKRKPKATRERRCSKCKQKGHKVTTCDREVPPKRPRGRPVGSGRGIGRGRGRGSGAEHAEESDDDETCDDAGDEESGIGEDI
jgi:hypothetical protein